MMYNKNKSLFAMMVILISVTGCLFTGLPLANAQIEETLSEESLVRIHESLDNIDRMLVEMQVMIDDMMGRNEPGKKMITRDYFEEQMSALEQRIVNATSSLTGKVSSLGETVEKRTSQLEQFMRAMAIIILFYVGSIVWKYKEGLIKTQSPETKVIE